jgi:hypothetical protein
MSDFFLSGLLSPSLVYRSISEWQQLARAGSLRPDDQLFDPVRGVWQRAAEHPALWPHFPMPSVKLAVGVTLYFLGLLLQALIERELRTTMRRARIAELPLYPEERRCERPTTEQVLRLFGHAERHILLRNDGPGTASCTTCTCTPRRIPA